MSAEVLRRAAALMRERAEAATPGPWERGDIDMFSEFTYAIRYADVEPNVCGGIDVADAEHIAAWHPAVALAVADWLDLAFAWVDDCADSRPPWVQRAEHVARAYLGADQ